MIICQLGRPEHIAVRFASNTKLSCYENALEDIFCKISALCSGPTALTIVGPVGVQPMSMITAITMRLVNEDDIDDCTFSLPNFSEGLLQYRTSDETHIILQFRESHSPMTYIPLVQSFSIQLCTESAKISYRQIAFARFVFNLLWPNNAIRYPISWSTLVWVMAFAQWHQAITKTNVD